MTTPKKKPRKKSRRVRMAEAVRKEATAALVELGFRNPKKADPSRWADGRLNVFLRWRGADFDEVRFDWDQNNRAMFRVSFNCSRVEASGAEADRAKVLVWFGNLNPGGMSGFFGPWRSINGVVKLLRRRLQTLDAYFHDGVVRRNVRSDPPHILEIDDWTPTLHEDDPWRDPEFESAGTRRASAKPAR